jgi:PAS domain S-box-containing protein
LEGHTGEGEVPAQETQLEADLFDALTAVYLTPIGADRARLAARHCLGGMAFEYSMALLAFVRTAHYWTETHPELTCEQDMVLLMKEHPDLARLLMNDPEAEAATLRNRVKQALVDTQKRVAELTAIVESSNDAIISKNLNGIITSWNGAASRVFGYSAEEIIGKSILTLIPENLKDEETRIIESIRAGQRIEHFETVRRTKDGRLFDVSLSISPIKDEKGYVIGASKILRDISDRKRIEQSLLQSEKLAATSRMAATIAHEINNPLEAVMNLLYLLRPTIAGEEGLGYLVAAESELERVSHIAKQTLGYYREHASATPASLSDIVQRAIMIYEPRCRASGIQMRQSLESSRKLVLRRGEMMQVISNLLANSIYATSGGGAIDVDVRDCESEPQGRIFITRNHDELLAAGTDLVEICQLTRPDLRLSDQLITPCNSVLVEVLSLLSSLPGHAEEAIILSVTLNGATPRRSRLAALFLMMEP